MTNRICPCSTEQAVATSVSIFEVYSIAPMRKVFAAVLILLLFLAACCSRSTTISDRDSPVGLETSKPERILEAEPVVQEAVRESNLQPEPESQAPITMSPVPATPAATPSARTPAAKAVATRQVVVQPSRSLAGHDRFLVSRPFEGVRPADFELGLLFDRQENPSFEPMINALTQAFTQKTLKALALDPQALRLAELLYSPTLSSAPDIIRIRFSEIRSMPGTTYSIGIRLFSDTGFAKGLAILGTDEEDNWVVNHLDLDLPGLEEQKVRDKPWDPYGYSRNSFD